MSTPLKSVILLAFISWVGNLQTPLAATADSAGSTGDLPIEIAAPNTPVIAVYKVNSFCEGPAWDGKGRLTFSSTNAGKVYSYEPALKTQKEFITLSGANGQEWANDGRLYVCARGGIYSFDSLGGDKQTFLTASPDPNDLTIDSKGNLFFSTYNPNFSYKAAGAPAQTVNPKPYKSSNGIEYLEEAGILYVNDYGGGLIYKYDVAADGSLSDETVFDSVSSPDGITVDEKGNVYVSSGLKGTIVVFNPSGLKLGEITVSLAPGGDSHPGIGYNTSNCVFGGPDRKTLFITGDGGLYAVTLNVAGRQRPSSSSSRSIHFHRHPLRRGPAMAFSGGALEFFDNRSGSGQGRALITGQRLPFSPPASR